MKVLIACSDDKIVTEIKNFLQRLCGLAPEEIEVAVSVSEFREVFLEHSETLRLIFVSKDLPDDDLDDNALIFTQQITKTHWVNNGLLIGCSEEDFMLGCQTYFTHDRIQSLTHDFRNYLNR